MLISPALTTGTTPALNKSATPNKDPALNVLPGNATPSNATKVTLQSGQAGDSSADLTYFVPRKTLTFASSANDNISQVMLNNIWSSTPYSGVSDLFKGLGGALLERFSVTQDAYQQTLAESWSSDVSESANLEGVDAATELSATENTIGLTLTTVSKKQIEILIAFDNQNQDSGNRLSVQIKTSAELSSQECKALAALSKGFESTLQSIGQNLTTDRPSRLSTIDVAGLLDFDPQVLSGIDLKVDASNQFVGLQALTLHADTSRRSLTMQGIDGELSIDVDLSNASIRGTPEQQKAAIDRYLTQFDQANARAQGQEQLIGQFKSAFAQLQSNYPAAEINTATSRSAAFNIARDQWLSGLADFQAHMGGEFSSGAIDNDKTTGKLDYQISQKTTLVGRGNKLSASQEVASVLSATIIKCRDGGPYQKTGNYDITQINDRSNVKTDFTIATTQNGVSYIELATRSEIIKQMLEFKKVVNHEVEEQFKLPTESKSTDVVVNNSRTVN
ncbi:hypothetical protein ABHF33_15500 [Chitinibacter sp. FCG-7]|uniref:Lactate dehydrogenase n=1 Tax=Chitinibacter mangrovi TaxID=3153927 RepID=A0AAU7F998_9NEIS